MGQIIGLIPFRSDHGDALLYRVSDRTLLGFPNGTLLDVISAIEEKGIRKIAVVGHVQVVGARPNERADDSFGGKKARGVARLDAGDLDIRRNAHNANRVLRRSNRACGMRAVPIIVQPSCRRLVGHAADAGHAVRKIYIGSEIGVRAPRRNALSPTHFRFGYPSINCRETGRYPNAQ